MGLVDIDAPRFEYRTPGVNIMEGVIKKRAFSLAVVIFLFLSLVFHNLAHAALIQFEATNVADTEPGEDLWQYSYQVSDFIFNTDFGFSIFFDPSLYRSLQEPPPLVNADWDIIVLQPDPVIPDNGLYDALALVNGASLADPFTLGVAWLGGPNTSPGPQPFQVNEFDSQGNLLRVVESGQTVPVGQPVDEPPTSLLIAAGILGLASFRRKRC